MEAYYLKHDPSVLRDGTHPPADWRQRSLNLFMKKINRKEGADSTQRYADLSFLMNASGSKPRTSAISKNSTTSIRRVPNSHFET